MAASGSSNSSPVPSGPKILLAKPGLVSSGPVSGKFGRSGAEDETTVHRSRLPSLNLLSDSWDFHIDRFLPFLTENTEFTVVGIIGPSGVGKSTIMNELYGFDGSSPGMLPPFTILSEDTRAMARHCTSGIEPRISAERLILLDTQPVLASSVLAEMMRPDGSSTVPVLGGESLSAELAHELMNIQLGVLLSSICHILLVISEGIHDDNMWRLMLTVDLLKHGIPDPSSLSSSHSQNSNLVSEKENKDKTNEVEEYMATPVFVHTKLQDQDLTPHTLEQLRKALGQYFSTSSFVRNGCGNAAIEPVNPSTQCRVSDSTVPKLFLIPPKNNNDSPCALSESYISSLWKLRNEVLSMNCPSFARTISEREWLKNSAKIWELVKSSPIISDYCKMLRSSGMFRK
ncbi:protein SMG9-like isoform X1 [Mangifera indica]|uniref:protein SMG9-like isoform X1 n=1 Tax=Mangifera indica TaxID=29780 RepID=UPI001CFA1BDB|nr:protein SMG9-like isoform X1 [Mangifera indica]